MAGWSWPRRRVVVLLVLWGWMAAGAGPPQIGHVTNSAKNYSPVLIFGEGFTEGNVQFYTLSPQEKLTPAQMIQVFTERGPFPAQGLRTTDTQCGQQAV